MKHANTEVTTCTESLKLLADFWTLRIIEALEKSELRFCEIQRAVGNVNPATLTKKLGILEEADIIIRREDTEHAAVAYRLSPLGTKALPVLAAIQTFSKKTSK